MSNRVNPVCNGVQPPRGDAVLHPTPPQAKLNQLPSSHNPILPLRQAGHPRVDRPRPSQATYIGGWDGLGGHAQMVPRSTARVARGV